MIVFVFNSPASAPFIDKNYFRAARANFSRGRTNKTRIAALGSLQASKRSKDAPNIKNMKVARELVTWRGKHFNFHFFFLTFLLLLFTFFFLVFCLSLLSLTSLSLSLLYLSSLSLLSSLLLSLLLSLLSLSSLFFVLFLSSALSLSLSPSSSSHRRCWSFCQ